MKIQTAHDNNWLWQDQLEDEFSTKENRYFTKEIYLPDNAKEWPECTDEEKQLWESEHQIEETIEEPTTQEVIENE